VKPNDTFGVSQFLRDYPGMSLAPARGSKIVLWGTFSFSAKPKGGKEISDAYELEITINSDSPTVIPSVKETSNRIPKDVEHHVYSDDTLCLGSPLRLLEIISKKPNLVGFSENCLVPYLYAVSKKLQNGGDFVFSELDHGVSGIFDDYMDLFGLKKRSQVIQALRILGIKQRIANKKLCPCGCGLRLGKCSFNKRINKYRRLAPLSWFRAQASILTTSSDSNEALRPYINRSMTAGGIKNFDIMSR
jgi:hypothetical protein